MRKPKEKIKLDIKKINLGQYDCSDDTEVIGEFETIENQHAKYANSIGSFIISFSQLEDTVDNDLATAINERAHEPGYRIIKFLSFRDKINLLKDDYSSHIKYLESVLEKNRLLSELEIIYNKLCELSEFRNKVAHANWQSLDLAGFVRTKIIENKEDSGLQFVKIKMIPGVLVKFRKQNESLSNRLSSYREKVWEAHRKEEYRRYRKNELLKKKVVAREGSKKLIKNTKNNLSV